MDLWQVAVGRGHGGDTLGAESRHEKLGDYVGSDLGIALLTLPGWGDPFIWGWLGNLWS